MENAMTRRHCSIGYSIKLVYCCLCTLRIVFFVFFFIFAVVVVAFFSFQSINVINLNITIETAFCMCGMSRTPWVSRKHTHDAKQMTAAAAAAAASTFHFGPSLKSRYGHFIPFRIFFYVCIIRDGWFELKRHAAISIWDMPTERLRSAIWIWKPSVLRSFRRITNRKTNMKKAPHAATRACGGKIENIDLLMNKTCEKNVFDLDIRNRLVAVKCVKVFAPW